MQTELTAGQKRSLLAKGYIVLKQAVPARLLARARDLIEEALPKDAHQLLVPGQLASSQAMTDLFNASSLCSILTSAMGPFPPVISCQVAVIPPGEQLSGRPDPHVDGGWSGSIPKTAAEIDTATGRPLDAARYFGKEDEVRGANDGLLWMDPEQKRLSYGSYTALVGVALSDQMIPGNGQFAVLESMHEEVEKSFRAQRAAGGVIGPEGPDWPRIRIDETGRPRVNGLPDLVRQQISDGGKKASANWPWPELTPVLMQAGDAVLALHSCPHTPTPNLGRHPRMNVYFRIRRLREGNPNEGTRRVAHGVSDHPDRGYFGQFLEYPEGYDPWQISIDKLCDHWSEWDGLQDLLKEQQP